MSVRAKRAGDAFDVERKLEKRYEQEDELGTPLRIVQWINSALNGVGEPCQSAEWQAIQQYLKDGVVLCRLMNRLLEDAGMPKITFRPKAKIVFVALANIEKFLVASREYGVPEMSLFEPTDLVEGRKGPLVHVVDCLDRLGSLANARGFQSPVTKY
ncbi:hypothetical protein NP493_755g02011 [Ridgeia piscesae]|uniref:Calponin-homology (CH) domain-containing protein n=1 Tax=Ridgeia piscesae TaxID=27915 RepID=A0AAD9NLT8_RIDPI|nr:hypothetical protein NP493_755g02011 [Ridgeia piscesae]